jgi:hypothetical protein
LIILIELGGGFRMKHSLLLAVLLASPALVAAQNVDGVQPQVAVAATSEASLNPPVPAAKSVILSAMTPVSIAIVEPLNSKTSTIGQFFDIRLVAPIMIDGEIIVPSGTMGKGEVIHAAKARAAGKAGELIIAARYLDYQGTRLPLRSLKYGADTTGRNNVGTAAAVGFVVATPLILIITGGQVDIPAGMPAIAKLATDVEIPSIINTLQQEGNP